MKSSLLFLTLVWGMGLCGYAQNSDAAQIPSAILNKQNATYPKAQDIKWSNEVGFYLITFKVDGKACFVRYDGSGSVMELQSETDQQALPKVAVKTIASKYRDYLYKN